MKRLAKNILNRLLARCGLVISRLDNVSESSSLGYISAVDTVSAANREGLSVCDYVEKIWDKRGDTKKVIEEMAARGVFVAAPLRILEIGSGTGRYLEKLRQKCDPARYEIYETAKDWAGWLRTTYPVVAHEADGVSLKQTPDRSIDLVHAHGVFVYLPFLVAYGYWKEIWRVTADGGMVVFDIYSEDCLDETTVDRWLKSDQRYPCFLSKGYVVAHFARHGFTFKGSFKNRHGEGFSEYLLFHNIL